MTFSTWPGWEAQTRRNNMIARCPKCGETQTYAIFVRSSDGSDLVCKEDK